MPKIQDNNWLYNILSPLVQFATRCHYNGFVVRGVENLPTDETYIIAPCHQQALMEPLAVLCFAPKPPVFLARADIFAKPTFRAILTFLRIMPVYRIRDGQDKLQRNKEIFDRCCDVLLDGYPLCLMAEGRHNNRHHLLPLRKGMFRIAGDTQLKLGDKPLYIVPTGIDFDEYERPYSNLVVNIGKPIPVQPFMKDYPDNEPVVLNQMRDALTEALLPLMHDIRDEEHYDEIMTLCNVLNKDMRHREGLRNSTWNRFLMRQKIARQLDNKLTNQETERLISNATLLKRQCQRLHINEKMVSEHWNLFATLLSLAGVAALIAAAVSITPVRWILLFCLLCYPIPFVPTHLIAKKTIADPQFRSSINYGIRLVLSLVYALVIGIVMACTGGAWMSNMADIGAWWGLIAIATIHLEARIAGPAITFLRNILSNCQYWLMRLIKHSHMCAIRETYGTLVSSFKAL